MLQLKVLIQTACVKVRECVTLVLVLVQLIASNHSRFPKPQMKLFQRLSKLMYFMFRTDEVV